MSPTRPPRVWITRAQPGADRTAARLRAEGFDPVVRPVLKVERLAPSLSDLDRYAALAFTSPNGVAAFAALTAHRDLPVFSVGDATAEQARRAGFSDVRSALGDRQALAALIAAADIAGPALAPGAETAAGDLSLEVRAHGGGAVETLAVYRTVFTRALPPVDADAVLVHSPRGGGRAADLAGEGLARMVVAAISPAAAEPMRIMGHAVAIASAPTEEALIAALKAALGNRATPV